MAAKQASCALDNISAAVRSLVLVAKSPVESPQPDDWYARPHRGAGSHILVKSSSSSRQYVEQRFLAALLKCSKDAGVTSGPVKMHDHVSQSARSLQS